MNLTALAVDLAALALAALGDLGVLLAGALIAAAVVDGLISAIQIMRE